MIATHLNHFYNGKPKTNEITLLTKALLSPEAPIRCILFWFATTQKAANKIAYFQGYQNKITINPILSEK